MTDPDVERELVALAHAFAEQEMRPVAAEWDRRESFPWPVFRRACEIGLVGFDIPEAYGGGGVDSLLTACKVQEELTWGDSGIAAALSGNGFFAGPVLALGTEEQKQRWVTPLTTADAPCAGLALTEPGAGSDAAAIVTHARKVAGGYVLNGAKTWISNAPEAELYLVYATVAPGTRSKGITTFVVQKGDEGFTVGQQLHKLGARACPTGELAFQDCFVPTDRRIGEEGQGFRGVLEHFDRSRVQLAAGSVGIGRAALEHAVAYAKEREAFGSKIHEFQAVSFRLVDAKLKVDQARLLTHHAARLADEGKPFGTEASMAKVAASEAAWFAAWACVQTFGGYGYSTEYPAERLLRDAKLEEIWEGTSDIQRLVIARSMFRDQGTL
ncbi:MAG: acyl-CoA dehydrogenase family protein [Planctomycetaceae bacterium]